MRAYQKARPDVALAASRRRNSYEDVLLAKEEGDVESFFTERRAEA